MGCWAAGLLGCYAGGAEEEEGKAPCDSSVGQLNNKCLSVVDDKISVIARRWRETRVNWYLPAQVVIYCLPQVSWYLPR